MKTTNILKRITTFVIFGLFISVFALILIGDKLLGWSPDKVNDIGEPIIFVSAAWLVIRCFIELLLYALKKYKRTPR